MEKKTTSNEDNINKIVIFNGSEITIQLWMVKIRRKNQKHKKRVIVGGVAKTTNIIV